MTHWKDKPAAKRWTDERVMEFRPALGLTQEGLAKALGLNRATIIRWEKGYSVPPPMAQQRLDGLLRAEITRAEKAIAAEQRRYEQELEDEEY